VANQLAELRRLIDVDAPHGTGVGMKVGDPGSSRAVKSELSGPEAPPADAQPGVGWVDGLVADGTEERGVSSLDPDALSGAEGVVDDDGGACNAPEAASEPASQTPETPRSDAAMSGSGGGGGGGIACEYSGDEPEADTVTRRVAEPFCPKHSQYGEMPVATGDIIQACETRIQNGWVYGYKSDARGEIVERGWLPAAYLVPLDAKAGRRRTGGARGRGTRMRGGRVGHDRDQGRNRDEAYNDRRHDYGEPAHGMPARPSAVNGYPRDGWEGERWQGHWSLPNRRQGKSGLRTRAPKGSGTKGMGRGRNSPNI